ncbi:hypothetical protein QJS04_geneDACA002725 [Acorus gramineus]|uniref:F-box domain-containing protein n=1 Tax=Acorus gramineus TaxID=55184 RepID=A0AAV9AP97_ACOGR|nr:hypothetical protein QJS04_geneDACA002725 [Acorus gramineus]
MSEEITPVSHLSPTDAEVSNVVENPDAGGRELRDWCDLPDLVLFLILKRLSLSDFFAFSHVCKEWRFVSKTVKREYMATQPPLVCGITSTHGFYSWKEERFYKKNQPALKGRRILGFSHGFFILLHKSDKRFFSLVNPITGGDLKWAVYQRKNRRIVILSEIFFKGKVYALNNKGNILIYDPSHHPEFTILRIQNNPFSDSIYCTSTRLADCGGELFAIQCFEYDHRHRKVNFVVQGFDFMTCEWERLNNLGNHVLFLDRRRGAFWDDAANWEDSENCIYYLSDDLDNEKFYVFHMDDGSVEDISCPIPYCFPFCWVFPRLCF